MYKNFIKLKFFISWWAFTFPLAAITIATMVAFNLTYFIFYKYLSYVLILTTTTVILFVFYKTVVAILKNDICIAEH